MPNNMLQETADRLYSFRPDFDVANLDELISNETEKIRGYISKLDEGKADKLTASNLEFEVCSDMAMLYEQKGFRDGFTAGIKFIMQAMCTEKQV